MNSAKQITITMTLEEWEDIYDEAYGHLCYWGEFDNEAIEKLGDIIKEHKNKKGEIEEMEGFIDGRELYNKLGFNENTGDNFFEWMINCIKKYDASSENGDYSVNSSGIFTLDDNFARKIEENHDRRNEEMDDLSELFSVFLDENNLEEKYEEWLCIRWGSVGESEKELINYELGWRGSQMISKS